MGQLKIFEKISIFKPLQIINTKLGHFKKLETLESFLKCPNFVLSFCEGFKIKVNLKKKIPSRPAIFYPLFPAVWNLFKATVQGLISLEHFHNF